MLMARDRGRPGPDGSRRDPVVREELVCSHLPPDLRAEHGTACLRLLFRLARCGIDAAGPPLLRAQSGA